MREHRELTKEGVRFTLGGTHTLAKDGFEVGDICTAD